jgi:cell wall-associated NlpC family hydrolase
LHGYLEAFITPKFKIMRLLGFKLGCVLLFLSVGVACRHKKDLVKKKNTQPKETIATNTPVNNTLQDKLGLSKNEIKSNKLFLFIDDWYGVPYKYGGCQKTGVDCSCFTNNLYQTVYGKKIGRSTGDIYKDCEKIKTENLQEGDLVFFITNGKSISHVGVYLRNNKFAHASTSKGVMVSDLTETYYKKCFYAAAKLKNL